MKIRYVFEASTISRLKRLEYSRERALEAFENRFREAFHREMTREEKRFFHLAEQFLRGEEEASEQSQDALWLHPATD